MALMARQRGGIGSVHYTLFKRPRAKMTVQALAVVKRLIQLDVLRCRRRSPIIDIHMPQTIQLDLERAKHRVVRMAGVTSFLRRHAMVLEMRRGNIDSASSM